jgi:hypothetical protein
LVYELYELSDDEIRIVEEATAGVGEGGVEAASEEEAS